MTSCALALVKRLPVFFVKKFVQKTAVPGVGVFFVLKKGNSWGTKTEERCHGHFAIQKIFWNILGTFPFSPLFVVVFGADEFHKR